MNFLPSFIENFLFKHLCTDLYIQKKKMEAKEILHNQEKLHSFLLNERIILALSVNTKKNVALFRLRKNSFPIAAKG